MRKKLLAAGALAAATATAIAIAPLTAEATGAPHPRSAVPPACTPASPPAPPLTATTTSTIGQAFYCILDHYYDGPNLSERALLTSAFAAFTQELQRRGLDRADAGVPALTGHRDADWAAFAAVYQKVTDELPADPAVRQGVAEATMSGLIGGLNQNHVDWLRVPNKTAAPLGMSVSGRNGAGKTDPAAVGPLFVQSVQAGGLAAGAAVSAGDEITAVDGVPPFVGGQLVKAVSDQISDPQPDVPVTVAFRRPATGQTFTVTLTPRLAGPGAPPAVTSRLLDGGVGYVQLPGFYTGAADQIQAAVAALRTRAPLHGLVLDLRGNGGGSPVERAKLLGMLAHDKVTSYECDRHSKCTPNHTDDSEALLGLPLVVLTDRDCASACDSFASSVKDLHLGTLVGARTAGVVAGLPQGYVLDDGSSVVFPTSYELGADHESVNGVGVAPDYDAPLTAAGLSAGHDAGVEKALAVLG
ncbi:MAG: PDZ domain-containing protein [Catenulispora sp.]|nr:PDZ domain-containing protein [Catenulispora sp.]